MIPVIYTTLIHSVSSNRIMVDRAMLPTSTNTIYPAVSDMELICVIFTSGEVYFWKFLSCYCRTWPIRARYLFLSWSALYAAQDRSRRNITLEKIAFRKKDPGLSVETHPKAFQLMGAVLTSWG